MTALSDETFHRRRHNVASSLANKHIRWSDRLLLRAHNWQAHLERAHVASPATLHCNERHEILLRRMHFDFIAENGTQGDRISILAGRFGTRVSRGRPAMRWQDGLDRSKTRHAAPLEGIKAKRKLRARSLPRLDSSGRGTSQEKLG